MIAFAKQHRAALCAVFAATALLALSLFALGWIAPGLTPEPWGWMMLFGALPWSLLAQAVPWGVVGIGIVALGLGFNAALVALIAWRAAAWWWGTVRARNGD